MNQDYFQKNFPSRAVHIDFHTMPGIYDFGAEFDAEAFAQTLADAHVEYVNLFAKCNLGFCYFDTAVGTRYPTMKGDLFGSMLQACRKRGIRVSAYFNVGLSHQQAAEFRHWCTVNAKGQVYDFETMNHWFRTMCFRSPYGDYITALVDELLTKYPEVSGVIFDSMNTPVCYGSECVREMRQQGLDPACEADMQAFAVDSMYHMQRRLEEVANKHNDKLYRFYLGIPAHAQPTHVEMEILPQGGWGYDFMPWFVRYIRTLGKPYSMMTGRFQRSWGDVSGLRPMAALEYDCLYAVATGANCSIGDHLHPRGRLHPAVYAMIRAMYERLLPLEPYTRDALPVCDILVVVPWLTQPYDEVRGQILRGFGRLLSELKLQYDVGNAEMPLEAMLRYRLILLPDQAEVSAELAGKLQAFLAAGGKIVATGSSGLDLEQRRVTWDDAAGVEVLGAEANNYTFVHPAAAFSAGLAPMEIPCYEPEIAWKARPEQAHGSVWRGYFQVRDWNFEHEFLYDPEDAPNGHVPLVSYHQSQVWQFAQFIGRDYFSYASTALRDYFGNVVKTLLGDAITVRTRKLPSFAMVSVMAQPERQARYVHILNYVPEKRGAQMEIIEDAIPAIDAEIDLIATTTPVTAIRTIPGNTPVPFTEADGRIRFTVPPFQGYTLLEVK